jgi:hypothetical protein
LRIKELFAIWQEEDHNGVSFAGCSDKNAETLDSRRGFFADWCKGWDFMGVRIQARR